MKVNAVALLQPFFDVTAGHALLVLFPLPSLKCHRGPPGGLAFDIDLIKDADVVLQSTRADVHLLQSLNRCSVDKS